MWKQQLRTKTSNATMDLDIKPTPKKKKTNCLKKLEEMANKLENYNILLEERWNAGWSNFSEYYEPIIREYSTADGGVHYSFGLKIKDEYNAYSLPDNHLDIYEQKEVIFNPIPEDVACEALRILNTHQKTTTDYDSERQYRYNDWFITRDYNEDYQRNTNSIEIADPDGALQISLHWGNGEDNGTIDDPNNPDLYQYGREPNLYKISGYYDAMQFGFNWHK